MSVPQTTDDVYKNLQYGHQKKKKSVNGVWWYDSRYGSQQEIKSYSHWIVNMRKETQQK